MYVLAKSIISLIIGSCATGEDRGLRVSAVLNFDKYVKLAEGKEILFHL